MQSVLTFAKDGKKVEDEEGELHFFHPEAAKTCGVQVNFGKVD